ncbi:MAG: helix-hairpin-helix domain-containing protein, partial [Chloroflexota bacterium]
LIRDYGFSMEELPFNQQGNLPHDSDPKLSWAKLHLSNNPIEINDASKEELLRIPGIGPKGAAVLLSERSKNRMTTTEELRKIGINPMRVAPFILINGLRPTRQLSFI